MPAACFDSALARLSSGCLHHRSFVHPDVVQPLVSLHMPIYLLSVPWLESRLKQMEVRLTALGSPDVTLVWCANREDVEELSSESISCLHPRYITTKFSRKPSGGEYFNAAPDPRSNGLQLLNGTLSLALKHKIAYRDMLQRRLRAALVLEDDATVPRTLWQTLSTYQVPLDADVFYCGSYSSRATVATLRSSARVNGTAGPPVMKRVPMDGNPIIGANAYIIFASGAKTMLQQPVLAEADIALSLLTPTTLCGAHSPGCPIAVPRRQYGPDRWLVGQDSSGGGRTHALASSPTGSAYTQPKLSHRSGRWSRA